MEQETKENIERLFIIKQKIKSLEAQAGAIEAALPDLSGTGTKIEFPATQSRPGFTVWQQTTKSTKFDQGLIGAAYEYAVVEGNGDLFKITMEAAQIEKIRKGQSSLAPKPAEQVLASLIITEGKASWRFKVEVDNGAE